ncbi:sortase-associated OmpA-like protein PdsO [Enterovibrio calviensis]|uniref:sortase-associated OmpA-like protein PdsO n=1 Tax=Enterovibrio calviensis TaxID=91359 RepID=UPI000486EF91|nr:sortase-associated OmpA-like protein PdsO [Enterovibrio calviensis]
MKKFNKTMLAISLVVPMSVSTAFANDQLTHAERDSTVEMIGFGGGAAFGAVVGGPVGAVAGALVGGLIGQIASSDKQNVAQEQIIADMHEENVQLATYRDLYANNELELANLKASMKEKDIHLELAMDIQFRTNSSEIEPHFQRQLDEVAELMRQQPEVRWDLEGHADVRGNQEYNLQLSQQRAQAVYEYLVEQGVATEQLIQTAYGNQLAIETEGDREGYFFDRRVSLRSVSGGQTAANQ